MNRIFRKACAAGGFLLLSALLTGITPISFQAQIISLLEDDSATKYLVVIDPESGIAKRTMEGIAMSFGGIKKRWSATRPFPLKK